MTAAVSFEHVNKQFRGVAGYRALRDDIAAVAERLRGGRPRASRAVTALDDVSFEIPHGGAWALMGPNGSGKTTALKIISRITYPSEGVVRVKGRVGALIEVGTGLHPELSGRENVFLYGRILGLKRREISQRFDSIVEFAEIGAAIDQPVKQFSSGMQLRLGFALASHLEPQVLLVDEAISVGDAGFQHRCLERMTELQRGGVTLLFVSHVPSLVAESCHHGVLLDRGRAVQIGPVGEVINSYLELVQRAPVDMGAGRVALRSWSWDFVPSDGASLGDLTVRLRIGVDGAVRNPKFGVAIADGRAGNLVNCSMLTDDYDLGELSGDVTLACTMRELPLEPGPYPLWVSAMGETGMSYLIEPRFLGYVTLGNPQASRMTTFAGTSAYGPVRVDYGWELARNGDARA
jgi:ABC-type polysaccharide/polyol phosphate transport system ATPase subunit